MAVASYCMSQLCAHGLALCGSLPCMEPAASASDPAQPFESTPLGCVSSSEDSLDPVGSVSACSPFSCGFYLVLSPGSVLFLLLNLTIYSNILNITQHLCICSGKRFLCLPHSPALVRQAPCLSGSQLCHQCLGQSLAQRRCTVNIC